MRYLWKKIMAVTISAALLLSSGTAALAAEDIADWDVSDEVLTIEEPEELFAADEILATVEPDEILISDEIFVSEETEAVPVSEESILTEETAVEELPEDMADTSATEADIQILQIEQIEALELALEEADLLYTDGTKIDSGKCGENLTWSLDSAGTLTISGTGAMDNWDRNTKPEWLTDLERGENGRLPINRVVIEEGVTSIGSQAFSDYDAYDNLTTISIPNSVTSIGERAFTNSGITNLTIPAGVTEIPESMCQECSSLTSVTMKGPVTSIGDQAFYYCYSMGSFTFPETVTSIGSLAFGNCERLTEVRIPAAVTTIEELAFTSCESLMSIYFYGNAPELEVNGEYFFSNWDDGEFWGTIYVSDIDAGGYNEEPWTSMNIVYLNSIETAEIILNEGNVCNYNGGNPVEPSVKVKIENTILNPESDYTVSYENNTEIGTAKVTITGRGDYRRSTTKEFQIFPSGAGACGANAAWILDGNTLHILGTGEMNEFYEENDVPWNAFASQIQKIEIASGITYISIGAFSECINLQSVTLSGDAPEIWRNVFGDCNPQILVSGKDTSGYDDWEWYGYTNIVYLNQIRPENVSAIPEQTYNGVKQTPDVTVTILDETLTPGTDYTVEYLNNNKIGTATATITGSGNYGGSATVSFRITDPEKKVVDQGTCGESGIEWKLETNGVLTITGIGAMPDYDNVTPSPWNQYYQNEIKKIVIGEGITTVGNHVFAYCSALEEIVLADTVTEIGEFAFLECSALKTVSFPTGIKKIDYGAFCWAGLTEVTLNAGLEEIGESAFECCMHLKTVSVPESVINLNDHAFGTCPELEYVYFYGKTPPELGDWRFVSANTNTIIVVCGKEAAVKAAYSSDEWEKYQVVYQNKISDLIVEIDDQTYTGNEIKPQVVVRDYQNHVLEENEDYTISWPDQNYVDIATVSVTITAADESNYIGSAVKRFNIVPRSFETCVSVSDPENKMYTGTAHTQNITVKDGDKILVEGKDYTVSYQDNVNAGTASVTIAAVEESIYQGSITKTFTIAPKDISDSVIVTGISDKTYTGSAQVQSLVAKDGNTTLVEGTDYTVTYKNNVNAGTATVVLTAKGNYTSSKEMTFKILPKAFATSVTVSELNDKTYTGNEQTQMIVVKDGNTTLAEGTDYTVAYKNNVNAGIATVVLTAKGNYTGSKEITFEILPKEFASSVTVSELNDKTYTGNEQTQMIVVKDGNTTLAEGTDYTVAYKNNVNAGTATVVLTAKGNYTGSKEITFEILPKAFATSVTVSELENKIYTGDDQTQTIVVKDGNTTLVEGTDYTITYKNNVNAGTATVVLTAKGNYTGSVLKMFEILPAETEGSGNGTESGETEGSGTGNNETEGSGTGSDETEGSETGNGSTDETEINGSETEKEDSKPEINGPEISEPDRNKPDKVGKLRISNSTTKTITLKWNKVPGVDGYRIYRWNSSSKKWKKLATTKKLTYTDKNRISGTKYKYAVSAYDKKDGKTYTSEKEIIKAATEPASVKSLKVKKTTKKTVTLSWKNVKSATGYIVYRQNTGSKKWVKVGTTKKTSYTNKKLKAGKNYKYAVSAYISYDGKTYSGTKKTVKAKTKK